MERLDAGLHADKERVAPRSHLRRRKTVVQQTTNTVPTHTRRSPQARQRLVDRRQPPGAVVRKHTVRQNIRDHDAIVAHRLNLPERILLPHRKPQLRRKRRPLHRNIQRRRERHPRRNLDRRPRQRRNRPDLARQRHDLRQRMHRLLQQDVARLLEHPMPELLGPKLAQRHIVRAPHKTCRPEPPRLDHRPHPRKGRVMHEVLVHTQYGRRRGAHQPRRRFTRRRQRLLQQHRDAGRQQRRRNLLMPVRRHQHMRPREPARRQRLGHRPVRRNPRPGQRPRRSLVRVHHRRHPPPRQRRNRVQMHTGNIACAD